MQPQLLLDGLVVVGRVGAVEWGQVKRMDQQPGPLDMGQELVSEGRPPRSPPRSTRGCQRSPAAVAGVKRAERRLERRERVIGDLRMRPGEP